MNRNAGELSRKKAMNFPGLVNYSISMPRKEKTEFGIEPALTSGM